MRTLRTVKVLVLSLAAIAAFSAVVASSASAKRFVTEDGNISCFQRAGFVRCDITKHKWTAPPKPKSCEFDYGSTVYLDDKTAGFGCVSDATGAITQYPAGTKFMTGPNTCRIRKNSKVKCLHKDGADVHGFIVGKKSYQLLTSD
jgi:hypothetical protein